MKYLIGFILAIMVSGCAITGTTALAFAAGAVTVAENVAEVATIYKDTKDYVLDNNVSQ